MPQLKIVQIIHFAFCAAIFLFAIVAIIVTKDTAYFANPFENSEPINFVAPIVAIFGLIIGPFMFKKILGNTAHEELDLNSKLVRYQTAFLIMFAFLEAGALMNIVTCLVTYNLFFMLFVAICFIAMLLNRPSKDRVYTTLGIQDTDLF